MSLIAEQRVGVRGLVIRGLAFTGLSAIAATSVRIAIHRFSGTGASIAIALLASFIAVAALNMMFVMVERWLEKARDPRDSRGSRETVSQ